MTARRKLKVVKFPKPKVDAESTFIRTLVWALEQARAGKVKGYAMVYVVETDGATRTIEAADAFDDCDKHHVLGAMRRMEHNYMRREWDKE